MIENRSSWFRNWIGGACIIGGLAGFIASLSASVAWGAGIAGLLVPGDLMPSAVVLSIFVTLLGGHIVPQEGDPDATTEESLVVIGWISSLAFLGAASLFPGGVFPIVPTSFTAQHIALFGSGAVVFTTWLMIGMLILSDDNSEEALAADEIPD